MTRLLDIIRAWPHPDRVLLPPTHCKDCGKKLHAKLVVAGYNAYGGEPILRIFLSCLGRHNDSEWLIEPRHAPRYGVTR